MEVIISKNYIKELVKLPKHIIALADEVIDKLHAAKSLQESGVDFTKMEGQKKDEKYYRIRVGDYLIGVNNINPKILIITIIHRGAIYKKFPPK
jgi:mRNA-degrading endonuclease RelE of RelBE toxin-antitoxin system